MGDSTLPKVLFGHSVLQPFGCEKSLPCDGSRVLQINESTLSGILRTPLLCYAKDQWNLTHCFSISGDSYCQRVEMCKEWLCSRKEWSGCFVKQRVLGDNSCWAPKSCFSLVLLLNVNVGHGSNAIFHSHSSELKSSFLFVFHINRTNCFLCVV